MFYRRPIRLPIVAGLTFVKTQNCQTWVDYSAELKELRLQTTKLKRSWRSTGQNHIELRNAPIAISKNEIYAKWTSKDTGTAAVIFGGF